MDIVAHGLYGGVGFINKGRRSFLTAVWWGIFPDLVAFGLFFPYFVWMRGFNRAEIMRVEPPVLEIIPGYIHGIYSFSHSFIAFLAVFLLIWVIRKKPVYEMLSWPLHIAMDIPTHSNAFFPTPFLFPLSSFTVNGVPWGVSGVFFSYWAVIALLYLMMYRRRKRAAIASVRATL